MVQNTKIGTTSIIIRAEREYLFSDPDRKGGTFISGLWGQSLTIIVDYGVSR